MDDSLVKNAIYTVWDYMQLSQPLPTKVDAMIVLGNRDERTVHAAYNALQHMKAAHIVVTGGAVPPTDELSVPL